MTTIFMILGSNEQLQQELEYTLLKPGEFQKCNLDVRKLEKNNMQLVV